MMRLASVAVALSTASALAVQLKSSDEDEVTRPRMNAEEKSAEIAAKQLDREVRKKAKELDEQAEQAKELEAMKLSADLAKKKEIAQLAKQRMSAEAGQPEEPQKTKMTWKERIAESNRKFKAAFPWAKLAREHNEELKRKAERAEARNDYKDVEADVKFKMDTAAKKTHMERTYKKEIRREKYLSEFNKKNDAEYEQIKAGRKTEVKVKADVCACMNWKEVYHKGYAQCGQGLEMTRLQDGRYKATLQDELADVATWHKDVMVQTIANEEFCKKSYKKMDTNACVRAAMEPYSSEWYGQYWCYVHPDCRTEQSDTFQQVPHRGTHIKICGPGDNKMGDWTPQEVIDFGKKSNMAVPGFLVKIAYPTERKCFKKTEDTECTHRMKDIRNSQMTTVVDETDEHGEKWIYQGNKAWIVSPNEYEGFLQVEPMGNIRELFRAKKTPGDEKAILDDDGGAFQPPKEGDLIITPEDQEPHRYHAPAPPQEAAVEPTAPAPPQQAAPEPAAAVPPQEAAPVPTAPAVEHDLEEAMAEPVVPAAPAPPQKAAPEPIAAPEAPAQP